MFKRKSGIEENRPFAVVYRSDHGGWEEPATPDQAFVAFAACVKRGLMTPESGRRVAVVGPDRNVINDQIDPLPSLAARIAFANQPRPGFPQLVFPRPTHDRVLDDPPPVPGWLPPLGDVL